MANRLNSVNAKNAYVMLWIFSGTIRCHDLESKVMMLNMYLELGINI